MKSSTRNQEDAVNIKEETTLIISRNDLDQVLTTEKYEIIVNETLTDCIKKDCTISGALLTQNFFKQVTFKNCVFFSSKIENCLFTGCKFENCSFQFSNFEETVLSSCNFENCHWEVTHIVGSHLKSCILDNKTLHQLTKMDSTNSIENCFLAGQEDFGSFRRPIAA